MAKYQIFGNPLVGEYWVEREGDHYVCLIRNSVTGVGIFWSKVKELGEFRTRAQAERAIRERVS